MSQLDQLNLAGQLPSPKGVALAIMNLCGRDETTIDDIARLVSTDPALSGRLLRLANSASSASRPVAAVNEALLRLGMKAVGRLALGFSLVDQYHAGPCTAFDYARFWSHSLLMAMASRELAQMTRVTSPEDMFTCGLLASIGSLALATAFPAQYSKLLESDCDNLVTSEREVLGIDNRACTQALLDEFGIPKALAEPIYYHDQLQECEFIEGSRPYRLTHLFHLARMIADLGLASEPAQIELTAALMRHGGRIALDPDDLGALFDRTVAAWREWAQLLQVPAAALPSFQNLSTRRVVPVEEAANSAALRIVLIEPDERAAVVLVDQLETVLGHRAYRVAGTDQGLSLALEVMPHVVLVGRRSPGMSTSELCRTLRATEWGQSLYLIMLIDGASERERVSAYEAGADNCLSMPTGLDGLRAHMRAAHRFIDLLKVWQQDRAQLTHLASELAMSNRRLEQVALTDLLTGLPNRRAGMEALSQVWSAACRSGEPVSLMIIDVDFFKKINDRYGHAFGDKMLVLIGTTLKKAVRNNDMACRLGGEEFLVICPNSDLRATVIAADRLRQAIKALEVSVLGETLDLTVSIGVAHKELATPDTDALMLNADKALYAAKSTGRNRVCFMTKGKLHQRPV
ncbi:MAG: diguanylate cyclase [Aeromicrobium sp.]|jgi:diguanylate cyclase (GGDEF)-like protein|nr:diguanylate cyclase [Gemmatimonadaceae bacterium]TXJ05438.1 MAG: diguanylate cyclase [Aeromicrobium sp.]